MTSTVRWRRKSAMGRSSRTLTICEKSTKNNPKPESGYLQLWGRMPCFALQNRSGKLHWLGRNFVVNGCHGAPGTALGHHITGTGLAATALRGHAQLKLNFIETHACVCMACNFAIGDSVANTNDHG